MKSQPSLALPVLACVFFSITVFAADPGDVFPDTSALNDQKAGSVLFYNVYTSSSANPGAQNTILNMTNTSSTSAAFVHLFWIASSCAPADRFICLTAQQTITMDAFQLDPGVTGRLIAVAVDGVNGCPVIFNHLIGDEYVKFADGFFGSLNAEALAALTTRLYHGARPYPNSRSLCFG